MVLGMSMIGSMAKIGLTIPNWAPMPTPESPTEAAMVAVPGIPAIPREPMATTKIVITIIVHNFFLLNHFSALLKQYISPHFSHGEPSPTR